MLARTVGLNLCITLAWIATASSSFAADHAVTVTIRSSDDVKQLALQFPTRLTSELQFSLQSIAGPVLDIISEESSVVVYLDWYTDLPDPIVCIKNYRQESLRALKELSKDQAVTLESGIIQIKAAAPIYLKEELSWLYIATTEDSLRNIQPPTLSKDSADSAPVQAEIQLQKIPAGTRQEIANVLSRRLLPPAIATVDEFSAEQLIQTYTKRLLASFANQADTIVLEAQATETGPQIDLRVAGRQLSPIAIKRSKLPVTGVDANVPAFAFHTSLSDEEVAYMTWWAQGLPDRTLASFQEAQIEDRSGEAGLQQLSSAGAKILRGIAQSGTLEGLAAFTGEKHDVPLIGIAVPDTKAVRSQLEQLANDPSLKELGLTAAELDLENTPDFQLHRFTFGGIQEEPFPLWIGMSPSAVYLMVDSESVEFLKSWLAADKVNEANSAPLQLNWPQFNLASYLGIEGPGSDVEGTLELTSQYTDSGLQFQIKLPGKMN